MLSIAVPASSHGPIPGIILNSSLKQKNKGVFSRGPVPLSGEIYYLEKIFCPCLSYVLVVSAEKKGAGGEGICFCLLKDSGVSDLQHNNSVSSQLIFCIVLKVLV